MTASYDWPQDQWTAASGDRTAEGRTLYDALRDLLEVRSGTVSPDWLIEAVQRLAPVETAFGLCVQCRCCGYLTLESYGHYDLCPVCDWEDDPTTIVEPDEPGGPGPNHISLSEGRDNFARDGVSSASMAQREVRDPLPEEFLPSASATRVRFGIADAGTPLTLIAWPHPRDPSPTPSAGFASATPRHRSATRCSRR